MALNQRKQQHHQQQFHNNRSHQNQHKGRAKGPAPQSYVFNDISNYEDNENNEQQVLQLNAIQNNQQQNFADDTDFNSSCCDYQSDVFKEQPSEYMLDSNDKFQDPAFREFTQPGILSLHECRSDTDYKENLQGSQAFHQSLRFSALSPNQQQANKNTVQSQQHKVDSQTSLRISSVVQDSVRKHEFKVCNKDNHGGSQSQKNSCEHSIISPNYRSQNNGTSTTNKNNKQPLYTMVPTQINKNLNKGEDNQKQKQTVVYSYDTNKVIKSLPISDDSADCILSGQNTIQNNQNQLSHINSYQNLTPQKIQPTPISPTQKPKQSNNSSKLFQNQKVIMINNNNLHPAPQMSSQQQQQYDSRNFNNQVPSSIKTQNSGQKATVVYNEFKYYTSGAELNNTQNPQKYINIANNGYGNIQRKSDISASHISAQNQQLQYELSPTNQNMFDMSSPKQSISQGQASFNYGNPNSIRANSIRKQIFNTERNHVSSQQNILPQNYQLQLKNEAQQTQDQQSSDPQLKIKELQNYIEQLECDLKESQDKNQELKRKFKDRSFIQSFERNKKHLSDTEDSLILSEKKGKKNSIQNSQQVRNSISKQNQISGLANNNSLVLQQTPKNQVAITNHSKNNNQLSNLHTHSNTGNIVGGETLQKSSSIVDVKIRPIMNLKNVNVNNGYNNPSPQKNNSFAARINIENQNKKNIDNECDNQLEYQVQDYSSQMNQSNQQDDNQNDESQDQNMIMNQQHLSEDECEGCERLKQLVFQAKEAIDDLKLEIEEWRDICSQKETELRQLHHKIYNDIIGVDKRIEFNEEIQTKEFDSQRPVSSIDQRRVRNFIQHNKNRIRSRSKNHKISQENINSNHHTVSCTNASRKSINIAQSLKKKSALKSVQDLISGDFEFYEAEDIGLQTSFDQQNIIDKQIVQQNNNAHYDINTQEMQTNVSINVDDSSTHHKKSTANNGVQNQNGKNQQTISPEKQISHKQDNYNSQQDVPQQYIEELCALRTKNQLQEQENLKMRQQVLLLSGQIEKFMGLMNKTKKKNNKKTQQYQINIDLDEIKQNHDLISNIESYSILEKINEWKREEGLVNNNQQEQETLPTQIPRPIKLIQDIDLQEIELFDLQTMKPIKINDTNQQNISNINSNHQNNSVLTQQQQSNFKSQMENAQDFLQMIKVEQENIKKQTDQKYKELQKQQQEYLNVLKGV